MKPGPVRHVFDRVKRHYGGAVRRPDGIRRRQARSNLPCPEEAVVTYVEEEQRSRRWLGMLAPRAPGENPTPTETDF